MRLTSSEPSLACCLLHIYSTSVLFICQPEFLWLRKGCSPCFMPVRQGHVRERCKYWLKPQLFTVGHNQTRWFVLGELVPFRVFFLLILFNSWMFVWFFWFLSKGLPHCRKGASADCKTAFTCRRPAVCLQPLKKRTPRMLRSSLRAGWKRIRHKGTNSSTHTSRWLTHMFMPLNLPTLTIRSHSHSPLLCASHSGTPAVVCALVHRVRGFQKRWVKLDVDYLSYFDNDKVTASMCSHKHQHFHIIHLLGT